MVAGSTGHGDQEASTSLTNIASQRFLTLMGKIAQGAAVAALALALVRLDLLGGEALVYWSSVHC